jgi:carbon starvation protein
LQPRRCFPATTSPSTRARHRRAKSRLRATRRYAQRHEFNLQPREIDQLQAESGEKNLRGRTGGAVTLALGIAKIFNGIPGLGGLMKYWYHFAIMFEALFILTTIDTGTRVARFLVGEFGGRFHPKLEEPNWLPDRL